MQYWVSSIAIYVNDTVYYITSLTSIVASSDRLVSYVVWLGACEFSEDGW